MLIDSILKIAEFIRVGNTPEIERLERYLRLNDSDKEAWGQYYRVCKRTGASPDFLISFLKERGGERAPDSLQEKVWTLVRFKFSNLNWISRDLALPSLTLLNLSFNALKSLEGITDINAPNLSLMAIDDNPLQDLKGMEGFTHQRLDTLSFTGCNLSSIRQMKTWNLPSLTILHLSFNDLSDLSPLEDLDAKNLATLSLLGNNLKKVDDLRPIEGKFKNLNWLSLPDALQDDRYELEDMFPGTTLYFSP